MNETELAYLAGFFDGEGCIVISKAKYEQVNKRKPSKFHILYQLRVSITQNEPCDMLTQLVAVYGGKLVCIPRRGIHPASIG